jgi:hypothetical protein
MGLLLVILGLVLLIVGYPLVGLILLVLGLVALFAHPYGRWPA